MVIWLNEVLRQYSLIIGKKKKKSLPGATYTSKMLLSKLLLVEATYIPLSTVDSLSWLENVNGFDTITAQLNCAH